MDYIVGVPLVTDSKKKNVVFNTVNNRDSRMSGNILIYRRCSGKPHLPRNT